MNVIFYYKNKQYRVATFLCIMVALSYMVICYNAEYSDGFERLEQGVLHMPLIEEEESTRIEPNWESIDKRPIPKWYEDAKFGIFIHWGVYSVPSFKNEWFWYGLENRRSVFVEFMKKNYPPNFTYQEFASELTGEFFNATQWAEIFENSGARYVSDGELAEAVRSKTKLHFGLYYSLLEWFHPLHLSDIAADLKTQLFVDQKLIPEMKELVIKYKPEIFWSDGGWFQPHSYWKSTEFLAWLYNSSPVKDTVVVNDRWGTNMDCHHGGYLTCRDPDELLSRKWENAMTIDKYAWVFRREANIKDFLTIEEILTTIAQTVSFNGNIALNVGITKEGTISPIYQERLADLGKWLNINGQAIYSTRHWSHCQRDSMAEKVWYTAKAKGYKTDVFAIVLEWPKVGYIDLGCLQAKIIETISMLGVQGSLKFEPQAASTRIYFPNKVNTSNDWAWCLLISYY
ncbi:alpha-L-fucosidase-like isoform X2 [Nilaparvata lugens]|uniref:alpha-L-fucosidase-like isoform X2 n=1 Tax=Nilaparvata lugens TaxID=108931 RepID=UPI00193E478E|nr:alpha-L-fucosidase-like isoform X2 [Nilaparvata lugens]